MVVTDARGAAGIVAKAKSAFLANASAPHNVKEKSVGPTVAAVSADNALPTQTKSAVPMAFAIVHRTANSMHAGKMAAVVPVENAD